MEYSFAFNGAALSSLSLQDLVEELKSVQSICHFQWPTLEPKSVISTLRYSLAKISFAETVQWTALRGSPSAKRGDMFANIDVVV